MEVASLLDLDPDRVFKTLVTQAKSGGHYVFMIPVACELDLKKAAAAVGEKAVAMLLSLIHISRAKRKRPSQGHLHPSARNRKARVRCAPLTHTPSQ